SDLLCAQGLHVHHLDAVRLDDIGEAADDAANVRLAGLVADQAVLIGPAGLDDDLDLPFAVDRAGDPHVLEAGLLVQVSAVLVQGVKQAAGPYDFVSAAG